MARKIIPGDVFKINCSKDIYVQFVYIDTCYLGVDLVRFYFDDQIDSENVCDTLKLLKPKYYRYTWLKQGLRDGLINWVCNCPIENEFTPPLFKTTSDVYSQVKKSYKWHIFSSGSNKRKFIGDLTDEYKALPIASVMFFHTLVKELETGWDGFLVPE